MKKLVNKRNDYYNKITSYIVQNSSFIAVQNENIIVWKKNKHLSHNLQLNAPRTFMDKIEYKCKWNNVPFIKVPKKFPSTQICSNCKKQNTNIKGIQNIGIRTWKCQKCNTIHDRDINASINILRIKNRWDNDAVKNSKKTYYNFFFGLQIPVVYTAGGSR